LQTGELVLGMVARFFPQKDHRSLLTAFSQIVKQVPQAKLLFMGDGPLRKELEEYGDQLGLNGSVRFLGIRRDIPELLQALDLCILSTHKEGLPIVLLEAMASSKAVVATAVDGCPELVIQGETGFVVPPEDPEALAHSIIELLTDRDQIQRMGLKGRERVRKLFTFEKMMQSYEEIYRSCARKKRVS
jgi:glycosyltransferase involved in cell wall biosynthesis